MPRRKGRRSFGSLRQLPSGRWPATATNLRLNTRALHGYLLRRFLLSAFADTPLADLDLMAVRSWLADLEGAPVPPTPVAKAYRLLARIMDAAVEAGLIVRNPCSVKGAATEHAAEMRVATVAQVAALAEAIHPRFRALVLGAAYRGVAWGGL